LPLKSGEARAFYAQEVVANRLSVRELSGVIGRKAFECREIAGSRIESGSLVPMDAFEDPCLLDFLGLRGAYQEGDLEQAIARRPS
jgi:predicted nuclease of restriction endonuclease-like (RecB) superfamily